MSRYIRHITLNTGHARDSFAVEVSEEALRACHMLIQRLSATRQPVPGWPDYTISGQRQRRKLVLTVWRGDAPIVTMGIALHSRDGAGLWRALHETAKAPIKTSAERCPPEPWAAVLIHGGLLLASDAIEWLGDFERCIAWAFYGQTRGL